MAAEIMGKPSSASSEFRGINTPKPGRLSMMSGGRGGRMPVGDGTGESIEFPNALSNSAGTVRRLSKTGVEIWKVQPNGIHASGVYYTGFSYWDDSVESIWVLVTSAGKTTSYLAKIHVTTGTVTYVGSFAFTIINNSLDTTVFRENEYSGNFTWGMDGRQLVISDSDGSLVSSEWGVLNGITMDNSFTGTVIPGGQFATSSTGVQNGDVVYISLITHLAKSRFVQFKLPFSKRGSSGGGESLASRGNTLYLTSWTHNTNLDNSTLGQRTFDKDDFFRWGREILNRT